MVILVIDVSPDTYTEDFSAAVDFLGTRPFVNKEQIGAIGICGSGSFIISAAKIDPRLKTLATVSMVDMVAGARMGDRNATLKEAADQRYVEYTGGETKYTGGTVSQLSNDTPEMQREFYDFYRTSRGEYTPLGTTPELTT